MTDTFHHIGDAAEVVASRLITPPTMALALYADPNEGGALVQADIDWLTSQGVPNLALGSANHWPVTGVRALFVGGRYQPCSIGNYCYRLAIIEAGRIIDTVAWNPGTGEIGVRLGRGWALGQEQIYAGDLGRTGPPIPVHRTPLGWLDNNRFGICIVNMAAAAHHLADLGIEGEDDDHQQELDRLLCVPRPRILSASRRDTERAPA